MGAQVDATIEMVQSMVSAYESGDLRILASFTNEPIEGLEEIEPFGKIYPEVAQHLPYGPYFGLFVAKGTPDEVVKVLEEAMDKAIKDEAGLICDNMYLVRVDYSGDSRKIFEDGHPGRLAVIRFRRRRIRRRNLALNVLINKIG